MKTSYLLSTWRFDWFDLQPVSYHNVNGRQSFQHVVWRQQRRAERVLDHRGTLHPHFSQLL